MLYAMKLHMLTIWHKGGIEKDATYSLCESCVQAAFHVYGCNNLSKDHISVRLQ